MIADGASDPRLLRFERIGNFRDYGGYACAHGRLRRRWLFRSGQHRRASDRDLDRVAAIGLASVIDLRGASERAAAPCRRPEGFAARIVHAEEPGGGIAPHLAAARGTPSPDDARRKMIGDYREMPFGARMVPILRRYFETLATVSGPSLIHCMAGKDRTGGAVALFHASMGVDRDDMLSDFLLTNADPGIEETIASGARYVRANFGQDISDEAIRVLSMVDADFLDAMFVAIIEQCGSIDRYLEAVLGVTAAVRETIAAQVCA